MYQIMFFLTGVAFIVQELGGAASVKKVCVPDGSLKSSKLNPPKTFKVERSSGMYMYAWHVFELRMPLKYGDSYELVNIHMYVHCNRSAKFSPLFST